MLFRSDEVDAEEQPGDRGRPRRHHDLGTVPRPRLERGEQSECADNQSGATIGGSGPIGAQGEREARGGDTDEERVGREAEPEALPSAREVLLIPTPGCRDQEAASVESSTSATSWGRSS